MKTIKALEVVTISFKMTFPLCMQDYLLLKSFSEIFTPFANYTDHLGGELYSTINCMVPAVKV
jgi:hypothetical protein